MFDSNDLLFIDHSNNASPSISQKFSQPTMLSLKNVPKISLSIPEQNSSFSTRHSVSFEIPKIRLENFSEKFACHSDDRDEAYRRHSDLLHDSKKTLRNMKPVHLVKQVAICESQGASKESLRFYKSVTSSPNYSGIDHISLDYMKANGNLRGFRQLRKARDLIAQKKAASFCNEKPLPSPFYKKVNVSLPESAKEPSDDDKKPLVDHTKRENLPRENSRSIYPNKSRPKLSRNKSMRTVGFKLGKRKEFLEQRKKITDFSCGFAAFGILVMILELELCDNKKLYNKSSLYSYLMKALVGLSTIILLALILVYHYIEVKILSLDDSIEDWRITISSRRIMQTFFEIIICSIHPFPGRAYCKWSIYLGSKKDISDQNVSIDIILGICMFSRLYLFYRCMLLHSRLLTDVGSRSIGAMNKIDFNVSFLVKTIMTLHPIRALSVFIFCFLLVSSWILHTCESAYDSFHADMVNSIWLICITFLSIGYGDVFPHTLCGRMVAIANGLMGCACTALFVAVFAKRLELSKAERHVIEFMVDNALSKQLKYYAANVLRETWLLYKYTKLTTSVDLLKVWTHQRKFLRAIYGLRKVKSELRRLEDEADHTGYLLQGHHRSHILLAQICQDQSVLKSSISAIESVIFQIQDQIKKLQETVSQKTKA